MTKRSTRSRLCFYFGSMTALALVSGCGSSDEPVDEGTTLNPLFACIDKEFAIGKPLTSDQFDPEQGGLIDPQQASYVIHTTQIFVPDAAENNFFAALSPIIQQLGDTPGLVAYSLANDAACGDYRTLGIWQSEEALYNFVLSGAHGEVLSKTSTLSNAARVTHWEATVAEVNQLTWEVAKTKISNVAESELY